jgi:hypothetical protein
MKFAWHKNITELVAWNSSLVEEVDLAEFEALLGIDNGQNEINQDLDIVEL